MPAWSLPSSLVDLLACVRGCFTAPTFTTFGWLVAGFVAQPGTRTVCGMLVGARLREAGTTAGRTGSSRPRAGRLTSSVWPC
jgi:hypothetical protein